MAPKRRVLRAAPLFRRKRPRMLTLDSDDDTLLGCTPYPNSTSPRGQTVVGQVFAESSVKQCVLDSTVVPASKGHEGKVSNVLSTGREDPPQPHTSNKLMNCEGKVSSIGHVDERLGHSVQSVGPRITTSNVVEAEGLHGGLHGLKHAASCSEAPKTRKYSVAQLLGDALRHSVGKVEEAPNTSNVVHVEGIHEGLSGAKFEVLVPRRQRKGNFHWQRCLVLANNTKGKSSPWISGNVVSISEI